MSCIKSTGGHLCVRYVDYSESSDHLRIDVNAYQELVMLPMLLSLAWSVQTARLIAALFTLSISVM